MCSKESDYSLFISQMFPIELLSYSELSDSEHRLPERLQNKKIWNPREANTFWMHIIMFDYMFDLCSCVNVSLGFQIKWCVVVIGKGVLVISALFPSIMFIF